MQTHLLRVLDFLVLSLKLNTDVKVYWTVQNANFTLREDHLQRHRWALKLKQYGYRMLYRLGVWWVDGFIAVSDDVKPATLDAFGDLPEDKIAVICNSVDSRRYQKLVDRGSVREALGLSEEVKLASIVATFKEQKGYKFLIEAAPEFIAQFPELHILFIGDGELRADLENQSRSSGVVDHIHFLGTRNDIPDLLAASDYFILPSLWEGLPTALVEAIASGLQIIATEVSGNRQVVEPGETGLLIPPGNVKQLSQAMLSFLGNPSRAMKMGQAARLRVDENYGSKKQTEDHVNLN